MMNITRLNLSFCLQAESYLERKRKKGYSFHILHFLFVCSSFPYSSCLK